MKHSVFFMLALGAATIANAETTAVGSIDDKITATEEAASDNLALGNDDERFGTTQYAQEWKGSLSATFGAFSDNRGTEIVGAGGTTDSSSASVAARLTKGSGKWNHSFGISYEFSSTTDTNGDKVDNTSADVSYEANRYLTDNFYGFDSATASFNGGVSDDFEGILALGVGYRVINNENMTWRVQAGPSYNYTATNLVDGITGLDLGDSIETSKGGVLGASRFWYKLSDTAAITNDTDVNWTDSKTSVSNDLGVTFKVTDALSARMGYSVEWEDFSSDDATGLNYSGSTNQFTTAIVYGF